MLVHQRVSLSLSPEKPNISSTAEQPSLQMKHLPLAQQGGFVALPHLGAKDPAAAAV